MSTAETKNHDVFAERGRLWSLWEMYELNAKAFYWAVLTVNSIRLAQSRESRDALRSWETFSN